MKKLARVNVESLKPIEQFIRDPSNPQFFFTMTDIKKIGINPRTPFDTPAAVCAYPVTQEYYDRLIRKGGYKLPFAGQKPYINLFTISDKVNVMANYTEANLEADTNTLKRYFPGIVTEELIDEAHTTAFSPTPIVKFWNLTRLISKDRVPFPVDKEVRVTRTHGKDWGHLLRNLGYSNFYDPGIGLIYEDEPYQFQVYDTSIIIPIDTYLNPHQVVTYNESLISPEDKHIFDNIKNKKIKNLEKAKNPNTPAHLLELLSKDNNLVVRDAVARNINTPPHVLEALSKDDEREVILSVVKNKNIPVSALEKLSKDGEDSVKRVIARFTIIPHILEILSRDNFVDITDLVAQNINTPPHVLEILAKDDFESVRLNVAKNINTPLHVLDVLSKDIDDTIRDNANYTKRMKSEQHLQSQSFHITNKLVKLASRLSIKYYS